MFIVLFLWQINESEWKWILIKSMCVLYSAFCCLQIFVDWAYFHERSTVRIIQIIWVLLVHVGGFDLHSISSLNSWMGFWNNSDYTCISEFMNNIYCQVRFILITGLTIFIIIITGIIILFGKRNTKYNKRWQLKECISLGMPGTEKVLN